jgi:diamine N-acetyltransferase
MEVQIIPLDRFNWEDYLHLRLRPEQEGYVPGVLYSLAQARFEALTPYGIRAGGEAAGFLMYGDFGGICWISRLLVDRDFQRRGVGREALRQLLALLRRRPACREVRTSYAADNSAAERLFASMGFEPLGEPVDGEIVARWQG